MDNKKIKDLIKKNPEPARGTVGVNPNDPWSAKANIAESSLDSYLLSKGINPKFVSKETKISHAKSSSFLKWKQDHQFESVELNEDSMLDKYLLSKGINPKFVLPNVKVSYAKSGDFLKWKKNHIHEETKPSALDKFRKLSNERQKKHDEIEKNQSKGGSDMTSAIDRLEKHLNKEESSEFIKNVKKKVAASKADRYIHYSKTSKDMPNTSDTYAQMAKHQKKLSKEEIDLEEAKHYPYKFRATYHDPDTDKMTHVMDFSHRSLEAAKKHAEGSRLQRRDGKEDKLHSVVQMKEEQIDEISKSTLSSYKDKSTVSLKNAQANRDAAEAGKHMSKGFADLHAKSDAIAKKRVQGLKGYLQRKTGMKPTSEDVFADSQAATQTNFDGGNNTDDTSNKKKELSKSARIIKSLYKKRNMKEDTYDWEKDDKNQTSYGKKPKVSKDNEKSPTNEKPDARAVLSGGTTLTGDKRDTLEIDPMMKNRPDLNGTVKDLPSKKKNKINNI
jgi:hypothetical protein